MTAGFRSKLTEFDIENVPLEDLIPSLVRIIRCAVIIFVSRGVWVTVGVLVGVAVWVGVLLGVLVGVKVATSSGTPGQCRPLMSVKE